MGNTSNLAYNYKYQNLNEKNRSEVADVKIVSRPKKPQKQHVLAKSICFMIVVVLTLSALIYTKVVQSELCDQYNAAVAQLNALKGENSRLQIKAEKQFSQDNIETIAKQQLKMQKIDNSKIEYIQFNNKDSATVIKKQTFFDTIKGWISGLFS